MSIPESLKAALSDRYLIEWELGAGGMATVYLAHDLRHHPQVALQVLRGRTACVMNFRIFREPTS
jgi:eukaryotic-like serine/threonine-protein kinase